ncbi:hypothetical protein [Paeniglutamicibacter sp. NPDC091659]|uniref:hypothetical protein n=1 Tax=Paeniglutamicibacter sp. NPDC091659 TaxID=3364389 RepID=UPI00382D5002
MGNRNAWFRQKTLVITGGIVAILALVLVVALLLNRPPEAGPSNVVGISETPTGQQNAAPEQVETYESSCGLSGGSVDLPDKDFVNQIKWQESKGRKLGVSKTAGPGRMENGVWSCYARTPEGALLAMNNLTFQLGGLAESKAAWTQIATYQTVNETGTKALLADGMPTIPQTNDGEYRGIVIDGYTDNYADLSWYLYDKELLRPYVCSAKMQWQNGDWKMVLQNNGNLSSGCSHEEPQGDYVEWWTK